MSSRHTDSPWVGAYNRGVLFLNVVLIRATPVEGR